MNHQHYVGTINFVGVCILHMPNIEPTHLSMYSRVYVLIQDNDIIL